MSNAIYPVLACLGWPVIKRPTWSTGVQTSVNGKDARTAFWSYPIWEFTLTYDFLRTASGVTEYQSLLDFYLARQGQLDTFLYSDPSNNAVTVENFGTGTGAQVAFQLTRAILTGGFKEPVQNLSGTPLVYVNGVQSLTISPPSAPTLAAVAGGALGSRTYYVKVTYIGPTGETMASAESSQLVGASNLLRVTSPSALAGAVSYKVYAWTTTNTEVLQTASAITLGSNWTEPTGGLISGVVVPVANTTGWSVSSTGLVTFLAAPPTANALTWTGSFYYRCRFMEDGVDFENFLNGLWSAKEIKFRSVKL